LIFIRNGLSVSRWVPGLTRDYLKCYSGYTLLEEWSCFSLGANAPACAIRGLAYMETSVMPLTWGDLPAAARSIFQEFRSESEENAVQNRNLFIETVLPSSVFPKLTKTEMD
jgi:hypothetical protein